MVGGARTLYAGLKLLPVQRKVILITREPKQITVDFALLKETLAQRHPEHRIVVIRHKKLSFNYFLSALREMYHLATCQACLVDGYIIPVSILSHRPELQVGQIWHALGAIKNFGHLASGTKEGPHPKVAEVMQMHQNYTFITASGSVPAETFTAAFGVPRSMIRPLGMPRIDFLLDEERVQQRRRRILDRYPSLHGRRVILYAPTFRRGRQIPYTQLAAASNPTEATLVLLPHPIDKSPLPEGEGTVIGNDFSALDWLTVADAVVTDYSAIAYEATLRNVPLVFWPYDLDEYIRARGLALDYHAEVPGPVVQTATEAMTEAVSADKPDYSSFRSKHLDFVTDEGHLPERGSHCTEAIVEALELK